MKICTVIPTLNEEKNIGELIDSIKMGSFKEVEIVVVDDGSTDKTVEIASKKNVVLLINNPGRQGPAFAWNMVAKKTKAPIMCFLGADFLISDKNFFEKAFQAFQSDESVAAIRTAYKSSQNTLIEKIVTKKEGIAFEPRFVRRDVFLNCGGFPNIGFGEDKVFMKRLENYCKKNGLKVIILKDIYCSGYSVQTIRELYAQGYWYGKTSLLFLSNFSGADKLKEAFFVYLRSVYLISFVFLLFSFLNNVFFIFSLPFFGVLLSKIFASLREKNPYVLLQTITYFISGAGIINGLTVYLLGINRRPGL